MDSLHLYKRCLVVAAHPDDEVLGCGGTILRLVSAGAEVHAVIISGITSSRLKETGGGENELHRAAAVLGLSTVQSLDIPDNRFDTLPFLDLVRRVELEKARVQPDLILTHDHSDLNIDHRLCHQAVLTAFRPLPGEPASCVAAFETLSSTEWQDTHLAHFCPNFYVDVAAFLSKKLSAFACYESEKRDWPHPRSLEGIEVLARKRGSEVGRYAAEAFRVIRKVV